MHSGLTKKSPNKSLLSLVNCSFIRRFTVSIVLFFSLGMGYAKADGTTGGIAGAGILTFYENEMVDGSSINAIGYNDHSTGVNYLKYINNENISTNGGILNLIKASNDGSSDFNYGHRLTGHIKFDQDNIYKLTGDKNTVISKVEVNGNGNFPGGFFFHDKIWPEFEYGNEENPKIYNFGVDGVKPNVFAMIGAHNKIEKTNMILIPRHTTLNVLNENIHIYDNHVWKQKEDDPNDYEIDQNSNLTINNIGNFNLGGDSTKSIIIAYNSLDLINSGNMTLKANDVILSNNTLMGDGVVGDLNFINNYDGQISMEAKNDLNIISNKVKNAHNASLIQHDEDNFVFKANTLNISYNISNAFNENILLDFRDDVSMKDVNTININNNELNGIARDVDSETGAKTIETTLILGYFSNKTDVGNDASTININDNKLTDGKKVSLLELHRKNIKFTARDMSISNNKMTTYDKGVFLYAGPNAVINMSAISDNFRMNNNELAVDSSSTIYEQKDLLKFIQLAKSSRITTGNKDLKNLEFNGNTVNGIDKRISFLFINANAILTLEAKNVSLSGNNIKTNELGVLVINGGILNFFSKTNLNIKNNTFDSFSVKMGPNRFFASIVNYNEINFGVSVDDYIASTDISDNEFKYKGGDIPVDNFHYVCDILLMTSSNSSNSATVNFRGAGTTKLAKGIAAFAYDRASKEVIYDKNNVINLENNNVTLNQLYVSGKLEIQTNLNYIRDTDSVIGGHMTALNTDDNSEIKTLVFITDPDTPIPPTTITIVPNLFGFENFVAVDGNPKEFTIFENFKSLNSEDSDANKIIYEVNNNNALFSIKTRLKEEGGKQSLLLTIEKASEETMAAQLKKILPYGDIGPGIAAIIKGNPDKDTPIDESDPAQVNNRRVIGALRKALGNTASDSNRSIIEEIYGNINPTYLREIHGKMEATFKTSLGDIFSLLASSRNSSEMTRNMIIRSDGGTSITSENKNMLLAANDDLNNISKSPNEEWTFKLWNRLFFNGGIIGRKNHINGGIALGFTAIREDSLRFGMAYSFALGRDSFNADTISIAHGDTTGFMHSIIAATGYDFSNGIYSNLSINYSLLDSHRDGNYVIHDFYAHMITLDPRIGYNFGHRLPGVSVEIGMGYSYIVRPEYKNDIGYIMEMEMCHSLQPRTAIIYEKFFQMSGDSEFLLRVGTYLVYDVDLGCDLDDDGTKVIIQPSGASYRVHYSGTSNAIRVGNLRLEPFLSFGTSERNRTRTGKKNTDSPWWKWNNINWNININTAFGYNYAMAGIMFEVGFNY